MEQIEVGNWSEFEKRANVFEKNENLVYRGQGDSTWHLRTSLARYYNEHNTKADEWRRRELKSYYLLYNNF
jgi:hypothetical protein